LNVFRYFPAGQLYTQELVEGFKARLVLQVMQSVGLTPEQVAQVESQFKHAKGDEDGN